jgi:UPF0755 protein
MDALIHKKPKKSLNNLKYRLFLIGLSCITMCGGLCVYYFFLASNIIETKRVYIHHGSSYNTILSQFKENKIVKSTFTLDTAYRILLYNRDLKRGSYILAQGMNNWQVISVLKKGLQKALRFTISYAVDKNDFIEQVCSKLDIQSQALRCLLDDEEILSKYGFDSENILSLFIPNTYELYWTISSKDFLQKMYMEYKSFWNEARIKKAQNLKLSPIEVSILASIVQSETNKLDEAPRIAGVYLNRLKLKIPLYSDPTIRYIVRHECVNRILKKDTLIESPYNTYKKRGLPPGPLCMPSIAYIDAVLDYEEHKFLYFSTKEDLSGYHYFAKTLQEHNNNARKYRKVLNKNKIFR